MDYKYGQFEQSQFHEFKKRMHSLVHWLLIYAEEAEEDKSKDVTLMNYFNTVQYKLAGYNELINHPTQLIEMMGLVESAKLEFCGKNYKHKTYRKIILDIHELIDEIPEGD